MSVSLVPRGGGCRPFGTRGDTGQATFGISVPATGVTHFAAAQANGRQIGVCTQTGLDFRVSPKLLPCKVCGQQWPTCCVRSLTLWSLTSPTGDTTDLVPLFNPSLLRINPVPLIAPIEKQSNNTGKPVIRRSRKQSCLVGVPIKV